MTQQLDEILGEIESASYVRRMPMGVPNDFEKRLSALESTIDQRAELFTKAEEIIATMQTLCDQIMKQNGIEK